MMENQKQSSTRECSNKPEATSVRTASTHTARRFLLGRPEEYAIQVDGNSLRLPFGVYVAYVKYALCLLTLPT